MIDGTLPWRTDSAADRDAADFRETVQQQKAECIADPERLTSNVALPGAALRLVLPAVIELSSLSCCSNRFRYGFASPMCLGDAA